jgi:hypothetical protein
VLIKAERNAFAMLGDLLELADCVSKDFIPMAKDDKVSQHLHLSTDDVYWEACCANTMCLACEGMMTRMTLAKCASQQMVQPNDGLALRSGQEDDYRRDSIERDEKRLAELGRKTVEMFVISHIITDKMEVSRAL